MVVCIDPARRLTGLDRTEDTLYDHKFAPEDVLGLDHLDKSGKTRTGAGEKAFVIRG